MTVLPIGTATLYLGDARKRITAAVEEVASHAHPA